MKEKIAKKNAIKAYKAFNADWTCRGFQYEVGRPYKADGKISICENGFHACEKASDCFDYYPFDPRRIKFAEVLCWGEIERADDNSKLCCASIQIVRTMEWEEVLKVCNSGNRNSGNWNSGNCNSGNCNSGDCNSGDRNSGYCNSGNCNSGNCNSGDRNSGYCNSGNCNSGNCNSGDCNSGYWNSGNWNSGNRNSGYFNTPSQNKIFCFNKLISKQKIEFPNFLYFDLIEWVPVSTMTDEEKNAHPECDVIGGYLKRYDYKNAFRRSFLKAKKSEDWPEELAKLKAIPNFDYAIFEEISGISKDELEGDSK